MCCVRVIMDRRVGAEIFRDSRRDAIMKSAVIIVACIACCSAWPLHRRTQSKKPSKMRTMITEAVESGLREREPTMMDFFLGTSNTTRKDWGRHLALAFENFRVPAALVAGTALTNVFALPPAAGDTTSSAIAKRLYLLLAVCSFMSSMITVALATSALVELNERDSGREEAASSLESFASGFENGRERWVAVNAHFIIGVRPSPTPVTPVPVGPN